MVDSVRRVVTTKRATGEGLVHLDDVVRLDPFPGGKLHGAVVWTTASVPADNANDVAGNARSTGASLKGGSVFRITEFAPGFLSPIHRTLSIDYGIVLSGMLELILDGRDKVLLHPGDVFVQRGTNHAWHNPSGSTPCRIMVCMIEAAPVLIDGNILAATPGWRMVASAIWLILTKRKLSTEVTPPNESPASNHVVVTAHDRNGCSIVASKRAMSAAVSHPLPIWNSSESPANNFGQKVELVDKADAQWSGAGSTFYILDLGPGETTPANHTSSIDYIVVLTGELSLCLGENDPLQLRVGDTVTMRGTAHIWRNSNAAERCRLAVCAIAALAG